jgi:hypothetical protein
MNDDMNDLDISWIQSHERFINVHGNYKREPSEYVSIYYVYINLLSEIEKIICEKEMLNLPSEYDYQFISKERVLQLVQQKKMVGSTKYNLENIMVYNVSLESENIQKYVNNDNLFEISQPFIKNLSVIDEIRISPSIFIFHSLNSVFFFFKQHASQKPSPIKSILKIGNVIDENKKTKKVRIQEEVQLVRPFKKPKNNATKKRIS